MIAYFPGLDTSNTQIYDRSLSCLGTRVYEQTIWVNRTKQRTHNGVQITYFPELHMLISFVIIGSFIQKYTRL